MYNDFLLYNPLSLKINLKYTRIVIVPRALSASTTGWEDRLVLTHLLKKRNRKQNQTNEKQNHKKLRKMYFKPKPKREWHQQQNVQQWHLCFVHTILRPKTGYLQPEFRVKYFKPTCPKMVTSPILWHLRQILILLWYCAYSPIWLWPVLFNLKPNQMLHYMVFPPASCALALVPLLPPCQASPSPSPHLIPSHPIPASLTTLLPIKTLLTARLAFVIPLSLPIPQLVGCLQVYFISNEWNLQKKVKQDKTKKPMYYWRSDSPSVNDNVLHIVFTQ